MKETLNERSHCFNEASEANLKRDVRTLESNRDHTVNVLPVKHPVDEAVFLATLLIKSNIHGLLVKCLGI